MSHSEWDSGFLQFPGIPASNSLPLPKFYSRSLPEIRSREKKFPTGVDREAGLAQGIRGTFFEHPLLVYNLGGLRPLGKHYQCYSGTVWCAVRRTPSSLLLLDTHPFGSLSFEGGTLDTQHHYSAPIAYNLICYTSFATTTYQHRTSV